MKLASLGTKAGLSHAAPFLVTGVVAVTGTVLLIASHAATPTTSFEPENGTTSGVTVQSDSSASGGKYISFGAGQTGGGGTTTPPVTQPAVTTLSGVVGSFATDYAPGIPAYGAWRGKPVQIITDYAYPHIGASTALGNTQARINQLKPAVAAGIPIVWTVNLVSGNASCGNGDYTLQQVATDPTAQADLAARYKDLATALVAAGMGSDIIRLGWEQAGNWYTWGLNCPANAGANGPIWYKQAFRAAVDTMRSVSGAKFKFEWNTGIMNPSGSVGDGKTDASAVRVKASYPGLSAAEKAANPTKLDYVDYVGMDIYDNSTIAELYNTPPPTSWPIADVWADMRDNAINPTADYAASVGKQLAISEWGVTYNSRTSSNAGGDDPVFVDDMHDWIAAQDAKTGASYAPVAYETYFNKDDSPVFSQLALLQSDGTMATRTAAPYPFVKAAREYQLKFGSGN